MKKQTHLDLLVEDFAFKAPKRPLEEGCQHYPARVLNQNGPLIKNRPLDWSALTHKNPDQFLLIEKLWGI